MKVSLSLSTKTNSRGESEVMMRIQPVVNGKCICMRAKSSIFVHPDFFDGTRTTGIKNLSRTKLQTPDVTFHKEQGRKIENLVNAIDIAYSKVDNDTMSKDWLKVFVDGYLHPERPKAKQSVYELAESYIEDENKAFSMNHKRALRVLFRIVARYEGFRREVIGEMSFSFDYDILTREDMEDLRDYVRNEKNLSDEHPETYKRLFAQYPVSLRFGKKERSKRQIEARGENCVRKVMKSLKSFFAWLVEKGHTTNKPFDGFKLGSEKYGTPYYITIDERNKIAEATMPTKHLETQRDIFVFQCLIGCRVGDLMKLTAAHIQDGILEYTPHKTKNEGSQAVSARIPLTEKASALVKRYEGVDKKGRLFPFISSQKYNDAIKEVFTNADVTRMVEVRNALTGETEIKPLNEIASSHLARRTFVGNLYFKVQDPNLIGKMSGHVEGSKAFARYRKIEDSTLKDVVNLLD